MSAREAATYRKMWQESKHATAMAYVRAVERLRVQRERADTLAAEVEIVARERNDALRAQLEVDLPRIAELEAEVESLKQELWSERGIMLDLKAEAERLREALGDLVAWYHEQAMTGEESLVSLQLRIKRGREALAAHPQGTPARPSPEDEA